jgi:hypothetical protein
MVGVDMVQTRKEEVKARKRLAESRRARKAETQSQIYDKDVELEDSSSSSEESSNSSSNDVQVSTSKKARGRKNILSPDVLSSLDRTKTSDRNAVHTISAVIKAVGQKVESFNVNRSSVQRLRRQHRAVYASQLKAGLQLNNCLTLHWDGKLMRDLTGDEKVDRLPVIVPVVILTNFYLFQNFLIALARLMLLLT